MSTAEPRARWYEGLTALHWSVLAGASAGWVFDVYEGQLFTIFKTRMLAELTGGSSATIEWQGNLGLAAFLLGGAVGGLMFGVLGDRYGRVRIMAYTILVFHRRTDRAAGFCATCLMARLSVRLRRL